MFDRQMRWFWHTYECSLFLKLDMSIRSARNKNGNGVSNSAKTLVTSLCSMYCNKTRLLTRKKDEIERTFLHSLRHALITRVLARFVEYVSLLAPRARRLCITSELRMAASASESGKWSEVYPCLPGCHYEKKSFYWRMGHIIHLSFPKKSQDVKEGMESDRSRCGAFSLIASKMRLSTDRQVSFQGVLSFRVAPIITICPPGKVRHLFLFYKDRSYKVVDLFAQMDKGLLTTRSCCMEEERWV